MKTLVFASPCCLVDYSSGAAVATNDCLQLLTRWGFRCQAYCAAKLDFGEEVCLEQTLAGLGLAYQVRSMTVGGRPVKLVFTRTGRVPVTIFRNPFTQTGPMPQEAPAFLAAYERFLDRNRPSAILTYGGGPVGDAMIELAKRRGAAVVFALHNLAYRDARAFRNVDQVIVPSQFAAHHYREKLGLACHVLPNALDPRRVTVQQHAPKYLTFVNPQPAKGLHVFARIAEQIARRRPDIPILVVESRNRARVLERTGVDLSGAKNLFGMTNTTDPRRFYAVTKVLLMPSLVSESFGLAAAEAMINGIPVLASNRGALPETVGEGGLLLDIPARYTPESREAPTAEEIQPWVEAIVRLWNDADFYRQQNEAALAWSARWRPEVLRPLYEEFFRNVHPQPGPPIVSREKQVGARDER